MVVLPGRTMQAAFLVPQVVPFHGQYRPQNGACRLHRYVKAPSMALPGIADKSLKILVVGSGGREHALVDAIARSRYTSEVVAVPGNVGMDDICRRVSNISPEDIDALVDLARQEKPSLVVVGPEVPLVQGLIDRLDAEDILAFGPSADAAILEGSKAFTKDFLARHNIPTAWYGRFKHADDAKAFIREKGAPIVVKADGLAAGKGVIIARTEDEACLAVDSILVERIFGSAGSEVIVEEFLEGEEVSFFAMVDENTAVPLASAQDHKPAFDGDKGPNTGGMGAYSPAPVCDDALKEKIMSTVVIPTMKGMAMENRIFRGVLYCGMMVDKNSGEPKVLEYNVRFGDPECQVLCKRLKTDMLELLYRTATDTLGSNQFAVEWHPFSSVVVVMATKGYPGSYAKGSIIRDIDRANAIQGVSVYHAGTARNDEGNITAAGGRVLGVTATGTSILDAQKRAYSGVDVIDWPQGFCRRDIGWRAIEREQEEATSIAFP